MMNTDMFCFVQFLKKHIDGEFKQNINNNKKC